MAHQLSQSNDTPGSVVMRAYLAANRGRYSEANQHLAPSVIKDADRYATSIRRSRSALIKTLPRIPNARRRLQFRRFATAIRPFEDPYFCLRSGWRSQTRERSIESIRVLREHVRRGRATVFLALHLTGGKSVKDTEHLVRVRGRWFIR